MGYCTLFTGEFKFNKPVNDELTNKINEFSKEIHSTKNGFPGRYCDWIVDKENECLCFDGEEQYDGCLYHVEWVNYLIDHLIAPSEYKINGTVSYQGDDPSDFGNIIIKDNILAVDKGIHVNYLSEIDTEELVGELKKRGYTCIYNE